MAAIQLSRSQPAATVLPLLESQCVSAVLEDCIDQLSVLGSVMRIHDGGGRQETRDSSNELAQIIQGQKTLETRYEELLDTRDGIEGGGKREINAELIDLNRALKNSTRVLAKAMNQQKDTSASDNLQKMQLDRTFLQSVLSSTLTELEEEQSFVSLTRTVQDENARKNEQYEMIKREKECRLRVRELQDKLVEAKRQREEELQVSNEKIAHLKDQLQEMKAKTSMESKYLKKDADVRVSSTQKKCEMGESELEEEAERLSRSVVEEGQVHTEIEQFLKQHQEDLTAQVEYWMNKHEKDVQMKQDELDALKSARDNDMVRLKELTDKYNEYEEVVVDDRIQKEKERRRAEQEALQARAATRVQAWWRGIMVRHQLGPYSKKKKKGKKSGKKGKKGKKGGKKKKR